MEACVLLAKKSLVIPVKQQLVVFILLFLYGLNEPDIKCEYVSFKCAVGQILLPLNRARLTVSPCFQSLC